MRVESGGSGDVAAPERPTGEDNCGDICIVVLAKTPVAGRVKTRLTSRYSAEQAATIAAACLADTFAACRAVRGARIVCALDGKPGDHIPAGVDVLPQPRGSLGIRISAAIEGAYALRQGPVLLIGMDTPQLTSRTLVSAASSLAEHDAVLGPAADGGWWLLGVHRPLPPGTTTVPASRPDTGRRQRQALVQAGLRVADLQVLRDVDTPEDADAVAVLAPNTRFARALEAICKAQAA